MPPEDGLLPYQKYNGVDVADRATKALTNAAERWVGESNVIGLLPGVGVRIRGYLGGPAKRADKGTKFLLTRVVHRASRPAPNLDAPGVAPSYSNEFVCVHPKQAPWYPMPFGKRPCIDGLQTAIVVGSTGEVVPKSGEEICVDKFGRVKVRFHWDRRTRGRDAGEAVSCWVRVASPMAGPEHGHVFIPRVGMEVAVAFENGNPDRPIVLGALYNGPFQTNNWIAEWKGGRTHAGFRTASVPTQIEGEHPARYNELTFEDAGGREVIHLRAEHDLTEEVMNDQTTTVGKDQQNFVFASQKEEIKGNQTLEVKSTDAESTRRKVIKGKEVVVVQTDPSGLEGRKETVLKNETIYVEGERTESVEHSEHIVVNGKHKDEPPLYTRTLHVHGHRETTVTQNERVTVSGNKTDTVKGALTIKAAQLKMGAAPKGDVGEAGAKQSGVAVDEKGINVDSQGEITLAAKEKLVIQSNPDNGRVTVTASTSVSLTCGDGLRIDILPDTVRMVATDGTISLACGGNSLTMGDGKLVLTSVDKSSGKSAEMVFSGDGPDNQTVQVNSEMMTLDFKGEIHFAAPVVGAN